MRAFKCVVTPQWAYCRSHEATNLRSKNSVERQVAVVFHMFSQQQPIGLENHFHVNCVVHALSTFPSQHHPVSDGQAYIFNARVGLDETVKSDDGVIIGILGIYDFAAPQNIVAHDQPARFD